MMKRRATIKRAEVSGGKRGTPEALHSGLLCIEPYAADTSRLGFLQEQPVMNTPHRLFETISSGVPVTDGVPDIKAGDLFVLDSSRTFNVLSFALWRQPSNNKDFVSLVLEETQ